MRRIGILAGLLAALAIPAAAMAAAGNSDNVILAQGQHHTGTYYAAGQTVTVDGDVDGDVVCGAQTVVINGSVNGDVLCAAQTLTVNGAVTGSVRAGGQVVAVNGKVGRNVTVGAQNFTLGDKASVGGEVAVGADTATLDGIVGQAVYAGVSTLTLNARVGGNLTAYVASLSMGTGGQVAGNLDYTNSNVLAIDKAKVGGAVTRHNPPQNKHHPTAAGRINALLYSILATLAGAMLAIWLAPRLARSVTGEMKTRWGASLGWGALTIIAGPVVLFVLALTVIGLPSALLLGMLWFLALVASGGFTGVAIGRLVLRREDENRRGLALSALAGVPIAALLTWLPVVGALFVIVSVCWAVGGMVLAANRARVLDQTPSV